MYPAAAFFLIISLLAGSFGDAFAGGVTTNISAAAFVAFLVVLARGAINGAQEMDRQRQLGYWERRNIDR